MALGQSMRAIWSVVSPINNFISFVDALKTIWRHRALCFELSKRDLGGQYAGQALGNFWIIGHPLLMLAIYTFVFAVVLKIRLATSLDMPRDYVTYLLAGLVPWLSLVQALTRSPQSLIGQSNLVKQVVFPIEVLPVGAVIASIIPMIVGSVILIGRGLIVEGSLPATILLLPFALTIHLMFMLGFSFLLAVATPFFRDIKDMVIILSIAGVYFIPAFYLPQWIPGAVRPLLYLNPFSYIVWMYQDIFYFGTINHGYAWVTSFFLAVTMLAIGYRAFRTLKPYVANVL